MVAKRQNSQTKTDSVSDFLPDTIGRVKAALADLIAVMQRQVDKGGLIQPTAGGFRDEAIRRGVVKLEDLTVSEWPCIEYWQFPCGRGTGADRPVEGL